MANIAEEESKMKVGERIKFPFGGKEKEGVVVKIFPKKVYLKVDFPKDPGKIVVRTLAELEGKSSAVKRSKRREKAEKEKKARMEKKERLQASQEKKTEEKKAEEEKE
jgi:hypothetical protein